MPLVGMLHDNLCIAPSSFRFIYAQDRCTAIVGGNKKKPSVPLFTKPFVNLNVDYDPVNTLLIDDTPDKCICNGQNTFICPLEFDGNPSDMFFQTRLMPYLKSLHESNLNVTQFLEQNPF